MCPAFSWEMERLAMFIKKPVCLCVTRVSLIHLGPAELVFLFFIPVQDLLMCDIGITQGRF